MQEPIFDKYARMGAYHWRECDPRSRDFNPPLVARYDMILKRVHGGEVLDVGAGDGYLAAHLARRCKRVVALEFEPSGVELARHMLADQSNVQVIQGDTYEIPCPSESFDVVIMADVIEHLASSMDAAIEVARVLRHGGAAYISTPQWRPDRVWDSRHVKEFRPEELKETLLTAFESVEMRFAWPRFWSDFYSTKIGWRLMKVAGRVGANPFAIESEDPKSYCQMLAIATVPRRVAV